MKKQSKFQQEEYQQKAWENWFILSCIAFAGIFFICTLEGSREIKELPYIAVVLILNLAICLYKGFKTPK